MPEIEQDDFKELVSKKDIIRELARIDDEIMKLHAYRYKCKRDFVGSPQSEILKLRRSFLFVRLCEIDDDDDDEWGELK
jgi:hypothetical protein